MPYLSRAVTQRYRRPSYHTYQTECQPRDAIQRCSTFKRWLTGIRHCCPLSAQSIGRTKETEGWHRPFPYKFKGETNLEPSTFVSVQNFETAVRSQVKAALFDSIWEEIWRWRKSPRPSPPNGDLANRRVPAPTYPELFQKQR